MYNFRKSLERKSLNIKLLEIKKKTIQQTYNDRILSQLSRAKQNVCLNTSNKTESHSPFGTKCSAYKCTFQFENQMILNARFLTYISTKIFQTLTLKKKRSTLITKHLQNVPQHELR